MRQILLATSMFSTPLPAGVGARQQNDRPKLTVTGFDCPKYPKDAENMRLQGASGCMWPQTNMW
jgi:hypothetical protein